MRTGERDKPLEWRPFSSSREHPLLLALGQQSETRLRTRGLPTCFCLFYMLEARPDSPTVVGLMWAGCRVIQTSRLWRQRHTFGEGCTTTPSRGDVLFVLLAFLHGHVSHFYSLKKIFFRTDMEEWTVRSGPWSHVRQIRRFLLGTTLTDDDMARTIEKYEENVTSRRCGRATLTECVPLPPESP